MSFRPVLVPVIAAVALSGCGINSVPTAEENAKARFADLQAAYQRRSDLIPNLVATVKGAAQIEQTTLTKVTEARARANGVQVSPNDLTDPAKMQQFAAAQGALSLAYRPIQEAYPQLQSQANFKPLIDEIEGAENRINIARRDYNTAVQAYNTRIRTFPDAVGARVFYGAKPMMPFEATPGSEAAPKVNFG